MKQKKQFLRPAILQEIQLLGDEPILKGSVVDNAVIVSSGQKVEEMDAEQDWNQEWTWE
ncbi:MAG: hypothetical protein K5910_09670 [Bacteroidales bacterium]|nr:hypothetical protein [Bacteroidales bacterium]